MVLALKNILGIICPFSCIICHHLIIKQYPKLDDLHPLLVVAMELPWATLQTGGPE